LLRFHAKVGAPDVISRAVPDNSIKSTPPPPCPSCGGIGTVKQEKTIKGASTTLLWHCTRCDHRWPIKSDGLAA
jgi:ribosomal protein L37AE/L43A